MKLHNYVLIFVCMIFAAFLVYNYVNQETASYTNMNTEYANALTAACHDAAKTINVDSLSSSTGVWDSKEDIEETLNVFYTTLMKNFLTVNEVKVKEKTPFVLLVDVDGFYLSFNAIFDAYGNATLPANFDGVNVISDINTWAEEVNGNIIRFYLSDYVQVTSSSTRMYMGLKQDVYTEMSAAGENMTGLDILTNDTKFQEEKNYVIIGKLQKEINYFLNTQFVNVSDYSTGYNVTLSQIEGEEWSRMIKNPSVISFMQGNQISMEGNIYNVYAYAGGEITNKKIYFISGDYYHEIEIAVKTTSLIDVNGITTEVTQYVYNGLPVTNFYTSVEDCAARGALPAPGEY